MTPKLFLGLPIYAQANPFFMQCLLSLQAQKPFPIEVRMCAGDGVARSRNGLTADFLRSDCSHLLFIDTDLIFSMEQVARIVSHDLPIVGGLYPKKQEGPTEWVLNGCLEPGVKRDDRGLLRVRYIGTTSTFKPQYAALEQLMRDEPFDFIGIDYAVDNLDAEQRIFPLAQDRGIAVMVYMPFGRTRLWDRVEGHEVPEWAAEFGATTWAQFFLKFAASHPAVTVVTPATSRGRHMLDNMTAAKGRLPDDAERTRMVAFIESLPS